MPVTAGRGCGAVRYSVGGGVGSRSSAPSVNPETFAAVHNPTGSSVVSGGGVQPNCWSVPGWVTSGEGACGVVGGGPRPI